MNKKVWNDDKSMMVIINTTASKILSLADGEKSFTDLLKESYSGSLSIDDMNRESFEKYNLATELNDRFLQSATFCISMWERGLLNFKVVQNKSNQPFMSPIMTSTIGEGGELLFDKVVEIIMAQKNEPSIYTIFNQYKANLVMLLAYDALLMAFTGEIESHNQEDVKENDFPQFITGYIEPKSLMGKYDIGEGAPTKLGVVMAAAGAAAAWDVAKTAAAEIGTTAGKIVGEMESR